jgi:hypothetical protein
MGMFEVVARALLAGKRTGKCFYEFRISVWVW